MGIRETLNRNPAITTGGTLLIIVIAVGFIIYSSISGGAPKPPTQAYFSTDDGKTYFADDINKIAPFQKDGKEAVKAYVFSCDNGKNPFVAYLERFTPEAKAQVEKFNEEMKKNPNQPPSDPGMMGMLYQTGTEVKKPGGKTWVKMNDFQQFGQITMINCPNGKQENLVPVMP